ncbi:structural maintenance of chromosomes protein 1A-like [Apis florea]|uniref:structural maintenance of chromosomes protein 1A-like n=1 Tax=Apis florea TaxID=7463 RepID=UPI0012FEF6B3|nr:structural maintenance of chromosomes protein 1A-like [Apis florea]
MTKVLGKYCNSIIVSTNKVAIQCINYLKEQQIGSETFLPVENLKVEPIKEILRGITEPKNVKLLYDVLKFELVEITNAILFVTKNTIVCETSEEARMLAYEINPYRRTNCVALDGTYYKKDGIISGGEVELLKKAQIWNEQNLIQLKSKKIILMEQLREKIKISQSESEINTLNIQIKSLTNRINYSTSDLNDHVKKKIITLQHEIEVIQNELDIINNNITSIKDIMMEKNQEIQNIEKSIMNIEDMIFKNFCNHIGISNIRQYEQGNLKFHQEQTKRKLELEEQYNRIQNLLDFEINRDTENAILKIKGNLKIIKNELEKAHQIAVLCTENNKYELNKLNNLQNMYDEAKNNINKETENINKYRYNISTISKLIISTQKEITIIKTNIKKKKAKCYAILINCKVN